MPVISVADTHGHAVCAAHRLTPAPRLRTLRCRVALKEPETEVTSGRPRSVSLRDLEAQRPAEPSLLPQLSRGQAFALLLLVSVLYGTNTTVRPLAAVRVHGRPQPGSSNAPPTRSNRPSPYLASHSQC